MHLETGSTIIIDGVVWTVESFKGEAARAVNFDTNKAIWFNRNEARYMGSGLFGLPGRIEPPTVNPAADVVAGVATATATAHNAG